MKPTRVLVTGAGSGVGQGIIKSLHSSSLPLEVLSADISPLNAGLFRASEGILIPKVEDANALERIIECIRRAHIDVLMVGSEFDLTFFAKNKQAIEASTGAVLIVSPLETVQIADDKFLTMQFLKENQLPYADGVVPESAQDAVKRARSMGFPLLLRTRTGTSNRHVHIVKSDEEILSLYDSVPKPMLQRLIDIPTKELHNEYTCSVFKTKSGSLIGPFTARRTLRGGNSWVVEVKEFKELHPLMLSIGEKLPSCGSLNVQLMIGTEGPVPFEFNARFSGTTAVRAHFGFNEPEMAIRSYHLGEDLKMPAIRSGIALRYLEEVFLEGVSAQELCPPFPKGKVKDWF